jgi:uncharacterized integral membrane protein
MAAYRCSRCGRFGETEKPVCPACGARLDSDAASSFYVERWFSPLRLALVVVVSSVLGIAALTIGVLFTAGGHGWFTPCILSLFSLPNYPLIGVGWVSKNRRLSRILGWYALVAAIIMTIYMCMIEMNQRRVSEHVFEYTWESAPFIIVIWAVLYFGQQVAGVLLLVCRR